MTVKLLGTGTLLVTIKIPPIKDQINLIWVVDLIFFSDLFIKLT